MAEETVQQVQEETRPNYGLIFIALAVFTGVEVGVSYLPDAIKLPVLILLSALKACLVLLYFMHLKSDSRLYSAFFVLGLVLIVPLILIMTVVMPALFNL